MRPVLVTWRGVRVPAYPVMLYLGLLAGTYSTYAAGRAEGLHGKALVPAILALIALAVLGARLAFVVGRWRVFRRQPRRIIARGVEGGAVGYGALVAVPLSLPLLAALRLPIGFFWDAGAVGFLAAVICLRIGCLLNGCCCGRKTNGRLALWLPNAAGVRARRTPTQLLEAGWAAALLVGAGLVFGRVAFDGGLFASLLAAYAAGRFVLGFAREEPRMIGSLTVAQVSSAVLVLVSLGWIGFAVWAGR
jgi:phosphatidylglycerol---prolipoprotein diacylglyceryl transferase